MSNDKQYSDVGMIIPGAPKMRAKTMVDALDFTGLVGNITDSLGLPVTDASFIPYNPTDDRNHHLLEEWRSGLTKDKLWPSPSYPELIEKGVPAQVAVFIKSLRDALPRHAHRPTPLTLDAFAHLIGLARELAEEHLQHWETVASKLPEEPPSYGRIVQIAALVSDVSTSYNGIKTSHQLYPVAAAPELSNEAWSHICDGVRQSPLHIEELEKIKRAFLIYAQHDNESSSIYSRTADNARKKSYKDLRVLQVRSNPSIFDVMHNLRSQIQRGQPKDEKQPIDDRLLGWHYPILALLKMEPASLPALRSPYDTDEPEANKGPEKKAPAKARRPERLTELEAKKLLHSPEEDGEDTQRYQDLTALIEMGMVRGIQWGEWVTQKERPTLVKHVFKSFDDLSTGLQITPSLAGLGNPVSAEQRQQIRDDGLYESAFSGSESIGLALGARGKSSAAAHYEPGLHAINLTRLNGAGALAHEWFHGLDYKLTQLISLDAVNRSVHKTDARKTTASKTGLRTFSDFIAHHWWMKTYKADRGDELLSNPSTFAEENERLILRALKFEVINNDELKRQVLPLMVGVAEFIREMYHRPREPEEMLERVLKSSIPALSEGLFHSYRPNADMLLNPMPYFHYLNTLHTAVIEAANNLSDPENSMMRHYLDSYRKSIKVSLLNDNRDLSKDLVNWRSTDYIDAAESIAYRVGSDAPEKLEKLLQRDIPAETKRKIQTLFIDSILLSSRQAVLVEHTMHKIRALDCPPKPKELEGYDLDFKQQFIAALESTLREAPTSLLQSCAGLAASTNTARVEVRTILHKLPPTAEGAMAGLGSLDLVINNEVNEKVRSWLRSFYELSESTNALQWSRSGKEIAVLRVLTDARRTPPHRDLTQVSGRWLEALGDDYAAFLATVQSEDYLDDQYLAEVLNNLQKMPDGSTPRDTFEKMAASDLSAEDVATLSVNNRRRLAVGLITAAFSNSHLNDGKLSSLLKVMRDPTLLEDQMPKGLPTLYEHMNKVDYEYIPSPPEPDWSAPETIREISSKIANLYRRGFIPGGAINRGYTSLDSPNTALHQSSVNTFLIDVLRNTLASGDMQGLEALEESLEKIGASFRYLPADEKRNIISSFAGMDAGRLSELICENSFKERIDNILPHVPSNDDFPAHLATQLIKGTHDIESDLHRNKSQHNFISNLNLAKRQFYSISSSSRAPSDFLLHSAAYDGAQFNTDKFFINPGSKRGYWYSAVEMFARCGEVALHDVLENQGISSPYLVTVPRRTAQDAALKGLQLGQYPGNSTSLNYPAGDERRHFSRVFEREVIPHFDNALNALFPDAKPAYEAYQERQTALEDREAMLTRIDHEAEEQMLAQGTPELLADQDPHSETTEQTVPPSNNETEEPKANENNDSLAPSKPVEQCPDTLSLF